MNASEAVEVLALGQLQAWYDGYRTAPDEAPLRFVAAVGLVVSEHLRAAFPLTDAVIATPGRGQVSRLGRGTIQQILKRYGEDRLFLAEGGRTTRGALPAAQDLGARLSAVDGLAELSEEQRTRVSDVLQLWLIERVREHFNSERIAPDIQVAGTGPEVIAEVLAAARARGKAGAVAQHLVGAKLALRFPDQLVENHSFTTADVQLGRHGDFQVNDTVLHVTVAPSFGHVDKCRQNLNNGFRVVMIVPQDSEAATLQLLALRDVTSRVWVARLEQFVGQNIEELSSFAQRRFSGTIRQLLETYNARVSAVEADVSLLIQIPENLR